MTHVSAQRTVRSLNHTSTTYNKPRIGFSYAVQTRAWLATANLSRRVKIHMSIGAAGAASVPPACVS